MSSPCNPENEVPDCLNLQASECNQHWTELGNNSLYEKHAAASTNSDIIQTINNSIGMRCIPNQQQTGCKNQNDYLEEIVQEAPPDRKMSPDEAGDVLLLDRFFQPLNTQFLEPNLCSRTVPISSEEDSDEEEEGAPDPGPGPDLSPESEPEPEPEPGASGQRCSNIKQYSQNVVDDWNSGKDSDKHIKTTCKISDQEYGRICSKECVNGGGGSISVSCGVPVALDGGGECRHPDGGGDDMCIYHANVTDENLGSCRLTETHSSSMINDDQATTFLVSFMTFITGAAALL